MNATLPKRIAILYSDAKREYFPTDKQYISEVEVKGRSQVIAKYLNDLQIQTALFPGDQNLSENLKKFKPDFVINLVDSVYGKEYLAATIPATLELLKISYTGSGMMGQAINSNKYLTRNLLEQYGLTIPKYQLVKELGDEIDPSLDYPLICKLNEIHGSIEIDDSAVCQDEKELEKRIKFLMDTYNQPVVVEEFIMGREITIIVLEGLNTKVYAAEKVMDPSITSKYRIATFDATWNDSDEFKNAITYAKYDLPSRVKSQIKTAFEVLKMEDYAKFDLRLDASGRHYFIDANTNPALGPLETSCAISSILDLYDIDFNQILERIIVNTVNNQ